MDLGVRRKGEKVTAWPLIGASHDRAPAATLRATHYHLLWDLAHHFSPDASLGRSGGRDVTRGDGGRACHFARGHGLESPSPRAVWGLHSAISGGGLRSVVI